MPSHFIAIIDDYGVNVDRSPFVHHKVKAGDKVGIIGVGGLGHVALQFAVKLGYSTFGISTSADKSSFVTQYGAGFVNINVSPIRSRSIPFPLCTHY